ncbi:MAG: hypothetical protein ACJAVK_000731 [Akkermansiaceae bacterium]
MAFFCPSGVFFESKLEGEVPFVLRRFRDGDWESDGALFAGSNVDGGEFFGGESLAVGRGVDEGVVSI